MGKGEGVPAVLGDRPAAGDRLFLSVRAGHGDSGVRRGIGKDNGALPCPAGIVRRGGEGGQHCVCREGEGGIRVGGSAGAVILRQDMQVPGFAAGLPGGEGFAAPELLPAVHREGFAPGPDKLLHGGIPHTDSGAGGAVGHALVLDGDDRHSGVHRGINGTAPRGGAGAGNIAHILDEVRAFNGINPEVRGCVLRYGAGEVEHIGVCAAGVLEAAPAGAQADLIQTAVDAVHDLIKDQRDGHPVAGLIGGLCHGGNAQELGLHGVIDLDMMLYLFGCPFVAAGAAGAEAHGDLFGVQREEKSVPRLTAAVVIVGHGAVDGKAAGGEAVIIPVGHFFVFSMLEQGDIVHAGLVDGGDAAVVEQLAAVGIDPEIQRAAGQDLDGLVAGLLFLGLEGDIVPQALGGMDPVVRPVTGYRGCLPGGCVVADAVVRPAPPVCVLIAPTPFRLSALFRVFLKPRGVGFHAGGQGARGKAGIAQRGAALHPEDLHLVGAVGIRVCGSGLIGAVCGVGAHFVDGDDGACLPLLKGDGAGLVLKVGAAHGRAVHRAVRDRLYPVGAVPGDGKGVAAVILDGDGAVVFGADGEGDLLAVIGGAVGDEIGPGIVGNPVRDLSPGGDVLPLARRGRGMGSAIVDGEGGVLHDAPYKAGFGHSEAAVRNEDSAEVKGIALPLARSRRSSQLQWLDGGEQRHGSGFRGVPGVVGGSEGGRAAVRCQFALDCGNTGKGLISAWGDGVGGGGQGQYLCPDLLLGGSSGDFQRIGGNGYHRRFPVDVGNADLYGNGDGLFHAVQGIGNGDLRRLIRNIFGERHFRPVGAGSRGIGQPADGEAFGGHALEHGGFSCESDFLNGLVGGGDAVLDQGILFRRGVRAGIVPGSLVPGEDLFGDGVLEQAHYPVGAAFGAGGQGEQRLVGEGPAAAGTAEGCCQ